GGRTRSNQSPARAPARARRRRMQTTTAMQIKRIRFSTLFLPKSNGGFQTRVRCVAICLIALFVALLAQETNASKQLAPGVPCAHLLTDLINPMGPTPPLTMIILNRETYKKSLISIIVPTLNEATTMRDLAASLGRLRGEFEVIVCDGGSADAT